MMRLLWLGVLAALIVAALALSGCGGGGDDGNVNPQVEPSGTVAGRVVRADNVSAGVPNAEVSVVGVSTSGVQTSQSPSATTDSEGNFTLRNVPVGAPEIVAQTPGDASLRSQSLAGVPVTKDETTRVSITLLKLSDPLPTAINLSPTRVTIDIGGQIQFSAVPVSGSGSLPAMPSFLVTGDIGTVSASGLFSAEEEGEGELRAYSGSVTASADITVTGSRPPDVSTFLAAPAEFTASGGTLTVTAAVNDGDGVLTNGGDSPIGVIAEVYQPNAEVVRKIMPLVSGTIKDGTFRVDFTIPGNSNTPDATGRQAPMTYSVRVVATDGVGSTTETGFLDFVVKGLRQPPPPF